MKVSILAAFLCLSNLMGLALGGGACYKDFKNIKDIDATIQKCGTQLGIKESDMPNPKDYEKNGWDDKCLVKCVLTEMKLAKDDGTLDMKAVEEEMKKNAPAGKADALTALFKTCSETTAKDATISKDPCKALAKTKICTIMGQEKICPPA